MTPDAIDVLVVEDNRGDVRMVEEAFENRALPDTVQVAKTGAEALDRLHRRGEFADATRPDLVLLDLNLPTTSGHAVLEEVKSDPQLKRIPVIVMTGSQSDDDLLEAYDEGANACFRKSVDPTEFADRVQAVVEFWTSTVELPASSGGAE